MNNVTEPDDSLPDREDVINAVITLFVHVIGFIDQKDVHRHSNPAKDFNIFTDDLTIFANEVEKHFGLNEPPENWQKGFAPTIEGIADYVLHCLAKKNDMKKDV